MRPVKLIDPAELRKHVHYDKDSGQFSLRIATARHPVGHVFSSKYPDEYLDIRVAGQSFRANRAAWVYVTGEQPYGVISHDNGWKHDNRWSNLRDITHAQSCLNKRRTSNTKEP